MHQISRNSRILVSKLKQFFFAVWYKSDSPENTTESGPVHKALSEGTRFLKVEQKLEVPLNHKKAESRWVNISGVRETGKFSL